MIWDPFEDLGRMHEEMDNLFGRVFAKSLTSQKRDKNLAKRTRAPVSDLKETEHKVIASIELPGIPKENIELNVTEDFIEVKGEQRAEKEIKKKGAYSYESRASQFYRKIPLPAEVKAEDATAEFKDGLLSVEIPKLKQLEQNKAKRIAIK